MLKFLKVQLRQNGIKFSQKLHSCLSSQQTSLYCKCVTSSNFFKTDLVVTNYSLSQE